MFVDLLAQDCALRGYEQDLAAPVVQKYKFLGEKPVVYSKFFAVYKLLSAICVRGQFIRYSFWVARVKAVYSQWM